MIKTKKKVRKSRNKTKKGGLIVKPKLQNIRLSHFKPFQNLNTDFNKSYLKLQNFNQYNDTVSFLDLLDKYTKKHSNLPMYNNYDINSDILLNSENMFQKIDYTKIINLDTRYTIDTFNKNKSKFIPLDICYYNNILPIIDYSTYNYELKKNMRYIFDINNINFNRNEYSYNNNSPLVGGGYDMPQNKYIIDLLRVFDSMHDFCESRGDVKSIKEISETVMGNTTFYDNILTKYGVTKSNIEVKFMEETENIINSYTEEILTSLPPSTDDELNRLKDNKFLLSKFTDDEINIFDDQNQTESFKITGDQYYIFKINQSISQIKNKMKSQEEYTIQDNYSIFIRSIKQMLNENFPNKKILFEAAAGHDLILRHFVINDKTKYEYAYVENFIPFQTIYSDASMWDSGNSGNKKVMNAKAMINEKTGKLDDIVDNPQKCFNNLTLHGLHIEGNESSAKISIRDKSNVNSDFDKKMLLVKTGPPVSLLSRGDITEINDTFNEFVEEDPDDPQTLQTSQEVKFNPLNRDCSGLAYATVFKRSGDWSQVEYCLKYNCIIYTYDRLCAVYAVYRNCPCIFETSVNDGYYMYFFTGKKDTKSAISSIIKHINKEYSEYTEIQNYMNLIKTYNKEDNLLPDINLKYNLNFQGIDYKFVKDTSLLGGNSCESGMYKNEVRNNVRKMYLSGNKKSRNVCYALEISTNNKDTEIQHDDYILTDMVNLKKIQGISKATDCEFENYSKKHTHPIDTLSWIDTEPINVLDFFNDESIDFNLKLSIFVKKFKLGIYLQSIDNPFELNLILRYDIKYSEEKITLYYTSLSNKGEIKSDCKVNCLDTDSQELGLYYFNYSEYLYQNNCFTETTWALVKDDTTIDLINFTDITNTSNKHFTLSGNRIDSTKLENDNPECGPIVLESTEDIETNYEENIYINTKSKEITTKLLLKSTLSAKLVFPLGAWYIPINLENYKYNLEISDSLNKSLSTEPILTEQIEIDNSKKENSELLDCSIQIDDDTNTTILDTIRENSTLCLSDITGSSTDELITEINKPETLDDENLNNLLTKLNIITNDINQRKEIYLSNCNLGLSIQHFLIDAFNQSNSNDFIKLIISKFIEISSKEINNSSKIFNWLSIYKDELDDILNLNSSISSLAYKNIVC